MKFYSRYAGARYYFSDGQAAIFQDGTYSTNEEEQIKQLKYVCARQDQPIFSLEPVVIVQSDAKVLRDTSHGGGIDVGAQMAKHAEDSAATNVKSQEEVAANNAPTVNLGQPSASAKQLGMQQAMAAQRAASSQASGVGIQGSTTPGVQSNLKQG